MKIVWLILRWSHLTAMFLYIKQDMNFLFKWEKPHFLHKNRLLLYEQLWWTLGPSLTNNINRKLTCEFIWANFPTSWVFYTSLSIEWFLVIWAISDHCHLISTSCLNPKNVFNGITASFFTLMLDDIYQRRTLWLSFVYGVPQSQHYQTNMRR